MEQENSRLRYGFTTGSCAAAAAKAAAFMLFFGGEKKQIGLMTPKGILFSAEIVDIRRDERWVSCGVIKDGGDDPDVTTGAHICARVSLQKEQEEAEQKSDNMAQREDGDAVILLTGGKGVGRVTRPGLDQPVGSAAINRVPQKMIAKEVREICRLADYHGVISVEIFVPGGEELAQKTFNPRLGICGGISVIGTSGVVEPMSQKALLDTIRLELRQRRAQGRELVAVAPGNYGREFLRDAYHFDLDASVKCSNFIGETIDMAREEGFRGMLLLGHLGKLVKLSGGIMNTHSGEADCRMELMAAAALQAGAAPKLVRQILDCATTEEAYGCLFREGMAEPVMRRVMEKAMYYLRRRATEELSVECMMYTREYKEAARSEGAKRWLTLLAQEQERRI